MNKQRKKTFWGGFLVEMHERELQGLAFDRTAID